jgi:hypothetical protein
MMLGAVASMLLPRRKLPKAEPIAVEDVATFDSLDVVPALMTEETP